MVSYIYKLLPDVVHSIQGGRFMEKFVYKEYTEEESRIYNEAMDRIMEGLQNGLSFADACGCVDVEDEELKEFIKDDALKIMIADIHYNKDLPMEHVSSRLSVPIDVVNKAYAEMLEDIEISTTEVYKSIHPDSPIGNA